MPKTGSVAIVGGCGRVGLPLGIALAGAGVRTTLVDINQDAVDLVNKGALPFDEDGAAEVLTRVIGDTLRATADAAAIAAAISTHTTALRLTTTVLERRS